MIAKPLVLRICLRAKIANTVVCTKLNVALLKYLLKSLVIFFSYFCKLKILGLSRQFKFPCVLAVVNWY